MTTATADSPSIPTVTTPLREELLEQLNALRQDVQSNPLANPIELLGLEISNRLGQGKLDTPAIKELVQKLLARTFFKRAERLNRYIGQTNIAANQSSMQSILHALAHKDGELRSFEDFQQTMEREFAGIVITAHPTFGINAKLNHHLAEVASGHSPEGQPLSAEDLKALEETVSSMPHHPQNDLTLLAEQALSLDAIRNIQYALRLVYTEAARLAQSLYPDRWTELTPRLMTAASWVGYDLDGRSDIGWNDTLLTRVKVALLQTEHYRDAVGELADALDEEDALRTSLKTLEAALDATATANHQSLELLPNANNSPEEAALLGRQLAAATNEHLTDTAQLLEVLSEVMASTDNEDLKRQAFILKSEVANYGFAMAHTHVRLNSAQLHNAIRHQIGIMGDPDAPGNRRLFIKELTRLLDEVEPVTINFGSILTEGTSAKRTFMVMAQILKHVDAQTPIRFLIAECDTPFTILTALYFARLFGIEDRIDISPLFETSTALERGETIIEKLLENPHYVDYIRTRGRICIQTGFSDAGRYLGQIAAGMAIERLRMKLARLIGQHSLDNIELVIFDTHGESIGRGAHPVSFKARLDYVSPPASLLLFAENNIHFKQELSFQGGDGYVYFLTRELAFATVCRILEKTLAPPTTAETDSFYTDTDYSLDFFITIKEFNERTMDLPNYATLLSAFGPNMLYPTGSRMVLRQHEGVATTVIEHPSQMRAIPHNAILQQLGFWSNSVGGLGHAIAKDDERFVRLFNNSARCRNCVSMAAYADQLSSLDVMASYLALLNPDYWFQKLKLETDEQRREQMRLVGDLLDRGSRYEKLRRIFRRFRKDALDLNAGLKLIPPEHHVNPHAESHREDLDLLHGLRIALIAELFLLAMQIPKFTNQAAVTMDTVIERLMALDVLPALEVLKRAFPADIEPLDDDLFGEVASYKGSADQGYAQEHHQLFEPIGEIYDLLRQISLAVSHLIGAVG
ncbi:MAG: phosphoenolpyruvate carboxylase [Myxococcota bacterium]|nr:phosphoenolpyruvate carboxylase [Myxococcota bacterium]